MILNCIPKEIRYRHLRTCLASAEQNAEALFQFVVTSTALRWTIGLQAKQIHKTATTNELENIVWLWTPPGREVIVDIPVRVSS